MFKTAIQLWPRPEIVIVEAPSGTPDKAHQLHSMPIA